MAALTAVTSDMTSAPGRATPAPAMSQRRILIVGGVAAGASCAARARRLDESAEIVVFEKGPHVSFANCGLPYHVGDVIRDESALLLVTPERFKQRFDIDVRVFNEVVAIAAAAGCFTFYGIWALAERHLLPRPWPERPSHEGVWEAVQGAAAVLGVGSFVLLLLAALGVGLGSITS